MTIGIYLFKFPSNLPYIGQSIDIERRFKQHCNDMQHGKHSKKVQAEYDKYKEFPTLEILAECTKEELNEYENECIEIWDSVNNGLNTLEKAEDTPKGCISGGSKSFVKYSKEQILKVFEYLVDQPNLTNIEISDITGVSKDTVRNIATGNAHLWLEEEFPNKYLKLRELAITKIDRANDRKTSGKIVTLVSPLGIVHKVHNISKFAREHGLHATGLGLLINQKIPPGCVNPPKHHKGWRLAP